MFKIFKSLLRGHKPNPCQTTLGLSQSHEICNSFYQYPSIQSQDVLGYYKSIRFNSNSQDTNDSKAQNKKLTLHIPRGFNEIDEKNKDTFLQVIDTFIELTRQKTGQAEFIDSAMKYMKEFGVHKDLETYKALISVMPKGKLVPENFLQSEFMHYPKQQNCIINVLEQMEDNGVIPDWELQDILVNIFGERGYPVRKYYRMMYWMPKFRHASPWSLPNPVPREPFLLAKLAVERIMSVDVRNEVKVYDSKDIPDAIDHTWIVSGCSPAQRQLIAAHPKDRPIYVEGGFRIWLRDQSIIYYILRSDPGPDQEYEQEDPDDLRNLTDPFLLPTLHKKKQRELTVHEQPDGVILGVAATGSSSQDSLLSWVRALEKDGSPRLGEVPIMFTMKSPLGQTEGNESIGDSAPPRQDSIPRSEYEDHRKLK